MKKTKLVSVLLALVMTALCVLPAYAEDAAAGEFYEQGEYRIHYTVTRAEGEFRGRIMFLHGFLYSGTTWDGMVPYFAAAGYDCYCADLPSFGLSTRESLVTEHTDRETLIEGLCETVAPLSEWIIAGHSMGGGVAVNIAEEHPEIKALLLYAPQKITAQTGAADTLMTSPFTVLMCKTMLKICTIMPFLAKIAVYFATDDCEYAKNYDTDKLLAPLCEDGTVESICSLFSYVRPTDMEKAKDIETPVLLVWAKGDKVLNRADMNEMTECLAGASVKYLEGNHVFIENRAEECAREGLAFLGS